MKSVIQEASSIAKAIEQGLAKAGNPRDFAIKILEYPEKNFFGLTSKNAKIALYCDDRIRKPHEPHVIPSQEGIEKNREREEEPRDRPQRRGQDRNDRPERFERRDNRDNRDNRDTRDSRDNRDGRDNRDNRDSRDNRDNRDSRDSRDTRDNTYAAKKFQPRPTSQSYGDITQEEPRREQDSVSRWTPEALQHTREWLTRVLTEMHKLAPFSIEIDKFYLKITFERPLFEDSERERRVLASLSLLILETCKHTCKINLRDHKVVLTHKS